MYLTYHPNVPHSKGLGRCENRIVLAESLIFLVEYALKHNILKYNIRFFKQLQQAIRTKFAQPYFVFFVTVLRENLLVDKL